RLQTIDLPVLVPEQAVLRDLGNLQIPAHAEVDDGRRDVQRVGPLVDDESHLPGPDIVDRLKFDADRTRTEERHALLQMIVARMMQRDVPAVAPDAPPEEPQTAEYERGRRARRAEDS